MRTRFLFFLILALSLVMLVACGGTEDVDDAQETQETENTIPVVYEDNENINIFINNYNLTNPDDKIDSEMVQKDEHHGRVHDDQVNILIEDGVEVNLRDTFPFQVFIKANKGNTLDNDGYKQLFLKYAKGYAPSLTSEQLDDYWTQTMNDIIYLGEFDEFELRLYMFNDNIEYLTINGDVQK